MQLKLGPENHLKLDSSKLSNLKGVVHRPDLTRVDRLLVLLRALGGEGTTSELVAVGESVGLQGIRKWAISDIFGRAKGVTLRIGQKWEIAEPGSKRIATMCPDVFSPSVVTQTLDEVRLHASGITEQTTWEFIDEAIRAFEANCPRASAVLAWVGAIWLLQEHVLRNLLPAFNAAAATRFSSWRTASSRDHLNRMQESEQLLVMNDIGMFDRNVKRELESLCLGLRNSSGHPNELKVDSIRVAAHLSMLLTNVYQPFHIRS